MLFNHLGKFDNNDDSAEIVKESAVAINEAILLEGLTKEELQTFLESSHECNTAVEEEILEERSIVKLDKKAKLSKATKTAIYTIAKEKKDPLFKKLITLWKMERIIEKKLEKKYKGPAAQRAKKQIAASSKSKSNLVKKATEKAKQMINSK